MEKEKTLAQIGASKDCDKSDKQHSHRGESYFDVYERVFKVLRHEEINFLELGVRDGKSLRVWREYFSKANILGVDINPWSAKQDTPRCKVEIVSQDDKEKLDEISRKVKGWDVVVDDASHLNSLTKKSFDILWSHVRSKGYYIIEDLKVSYSDLSNLPDHWNFLHLNPNSPSRVNDRNVLNDLFFDLIKETDMARGDVRSVQFFHQMVIIQKV